MKMNINNIRKILYTSAKFLGDINAVQKGKIAQRIVRRTAGRSTGKILQKIFRSLFH